MAIKPVAARRNQRQPGEVGDAGACSIFDGAVPMAELKFGAQRAGSYPRR